MYSLIFLVLLTKFSMASVNVTGYESFPINPTIHETKISLTPNDKFILVIYTNPYTGAKCYIENINSLDKIVPINIDEEGLGEYEAKSSTNPFLGGHTFFKFQALEVGSTNITLLYKNNLEVNRSNKIVVNINIIDIGII